MTGLGQAQQLFGAAWQLPAALVAVWLVLMVLRRRIPPSFFVVATGACSLVPLVVFLWAVVVGRGSGREQGAGGPGTGAGSDIPLWSFLSILTGLASVIVLCLLTWVVELVRLLLLRPAGSKAAGKLRPAAPRHRPPQAVFSFHWRRAIGSETTHRTAQDNRDAHVAVGVVRQQLLNPVAVEQGSEGSASGATGGPG